MTRPLAHGPVLRYLATQGYRAEIQPYAGAHRCIFRCGEERWEGRGASAGAAIEAALCQIVPSKITRALLADAVEKPDAKSHATQPITGARKTA